VIAPCVVCPAWHVECFEVTDECDAGQLRSGVPYRVSTRDGTPLCIHPVKIGLPVGHHEGKRLRECRGRIKMVSAP
jgi:hypothetical protein